jgi:hypothetical protein
VQATFLNQSTSTQPSSLPGGTNVLGGLQPTDLLVIGGIGIIAVVLITIVLRARGKPEESETATQEETK